MFIIFICITLLNGCNTSKPEKDWVNADPLLLTYMPTQLSGYFGDGNYYHVSNRIEVTSDEQGSWTRVYGEVKDNQKGYSKVDFKYTLSYLVDADKITQTHYGEALNDSSFEFIELLKRPVEVGNSWQFTTRDLTGKSIKVTGEILEVLEDGARVIIKHSTKDGYYELRDLVQGLGVTDFIRQVVYKNEYTLSGYHIERHDALGTLHEESDVEAIEIPEAYHALIHKFEESWSLYIKEGETALLETVMPESNAETKIKSMQHIPSYDLEFIQFIPYDLLIVGNAYIVYVKEQFQNTIGEVIENKMMFTLITSDDQIRIIDFEIIK